jgi:DNA-binding MurR/RpiR family transcriptional regulator
VSVLATLIAKRKLRLTAAQRKIADYVLANPFPVATMGVEELASATGTSPATITRFVKALDLDGFLAFRLHAVAGYQELLRPVENVDRARNIAPAQVAENSLENAAQLLRELTRNGKSPNWENVAANITSARHVAFLGFGLSASLLQLFASEVEPFAKSQIMLTGSGGLERVAQRVDYLRPEDLVIAMSLYRYSQSTVDFLKLARGRGAQCIVITDSLNSPIYSLGHERIIIPASHPVLHSSMSGALAVFEAIVAVLVAHHQSVSDAVSVTRSLMPYLYAEGEN